MKTLRTVETVFGQSWSEHAGSSSNTIGKASISSMQGIADNAAVSALSIYNTGAMPAYVKSKDGVIKCIEPMKAMSSNHFTSQLLRNYKGNILFETKESFHREDIDGPNINEVHRLPLEQRGLRHLLIDEQHEHRKQYGQSFLPGNTRGVWYGTNIPVDSNEIWLHSTMKVSVTDLLENSDPVYVKEHNLLLAYGEDGLRKLRLIPHPHCNRSADRIVQQYLKMMEGRVIDEVVAGLSRGPLNTLEVGWDLDGIVPYAILIVDNNKTIGDRWYFNGGTVHCVRAMQLPDVRSGVYVVKQVTDDFEVAKNKTEMVYYSEPLSVMEYKLYASVEQAKCSDEYQATIEFKRKIALNEQQLLLKERDHELLAEKYERETRKAQAEKEALERDILAAKEKSEREREKARIEHERYERERIASEEKFRQEQDRWERERKSAQEKFAYDQERMTQEREAFESKSKFEKAIGKMKFFTETVKSIVAFSAIVVPVGIKIFSVLKARALAKAAMAVI